VVIAAPVSARLLQSAGGLALYCRARGLPLLINHIYSGPVLAAGETLSWRIKPNGTATRRVWVIDFRGSADVSINGASGTFLAPASGGGWIHALELKTGVSRSAAEVAVTLTVLSGTLDLVSISGWEVPRATLELDATDSPVDLLSLRHSTPLLAAPYSGLGGLADSVAASDGRRGCLMAASGSYGNALGAWTPVFRRPYVVCPPPVSVGTTRTRCRWSVFASVTTGGTTAEVRLVRADGGTSSAVSVSSTTRTLSAASDLDLLSDDFSQADGHPAGGPDTVQVETRVTAGGGSVVIHALSLWDTWQGV
jgi:hypothetical protein